MHNFWQRLVAAGKGWPREAMERHHRQQLVHVFILYTLLLAFAITGINLGLLLFAGAPSAYVTYAIVGAVSALLLAGLWWLNRAGHVRWASYLYLFFLVLVSSVLFTPDTLERIFIIYTIPILAASFLISPKASFPFAFLSILSYSLTYPYYGRDLGYNYVAGLILIMLALIAWVSSSWLERALAEALREVGERKRAEEEIRQQARTLSALHETALDLAAQSDLDDLLQAIMSRAIELSRAKFGGIHLYQADQDALELVFSYNITSPFAGFMLRRGEGMVGRVLEHKRALLIPDYSCWEHRVGELSYLELAAAVAVPILWGERFWGVLTLFDDVAGTFSMVDVALLEQFASLVAAALEQNRLLEEARSRWREAETLRQAGAAVTEVLSLDARLERILEQLERVVPYDSASVQLLGEGYVEIVGGRGFQDPDAVIGLRFPMPGDNPNTVVIEGRQPFILGDARSAHTPFREAPHDHIRSWLGVPLIVHEREIGLLAVDSTELNHFNEDHVRLVTPFAAQVAVAIEHARLYNDLQQQMVQLRDTQAQLIQSAKLAGIGELAAGVAHELNNPLTGVLGFSEILLETVTDPSLRRDLGIITAEARRARNIVRSLLDFARQSPPERLPVDVNQLLEESLAVIRSYLERGGMVIEEEYADDLEPMLLDASQMKQVFLNLITNASQAMPQGGHMHLRTVRVGGEVAVSIADNGMGIPPEHLDLIFDPFFTTKVSGTGLGLSVSLGIVQNHGGRIEVESGAGRGSTFTVWLPAEAGS